MEEDFSDYLVDVINKGALSLMISIGHRTKLFDVLSMLPPSTNRRYCIKIKIKSKVHQRMAWSDGNRKDC